MHATAQNATPPVCARLVSAAGELPLRACAIEAQAEAGYARVRVTQTFVHTGDGPLEVQYQLPLPTDGAVAGFAFVLGDVRVVGEIAPRREAKERYEQALFEGRAAGLLEHTRDGLFQQSLGNVPAGAEVHVEVEIDQPLAWRDGGWEWRFPTVVAPRYVDAGVGDAARLTVAVADRPLPARLAFSLMVGDRLTGAPGSPSHELVVDGGRVGVAGPVRLDRDVVVRWPVAQPAPGVSAVFGEARGERFALLTVVPPCVPAPPVPRDLILLLDVSGSMSGTPLEQARAVCRELIAGLGPADTLEMVAFGGDVRRWAAAARAMDEVGRREAIAWLSRQTAQGGTPMDEGIRAALAGQRPDAQRQVLLVSDGHIGFEARVVGMITRSLGRSSRLHVLGVGHAVNRALTVPAARAGHGVEEVVAPGEPVGPAVARLRARMDRPQIVDLTVQGGKVVAPERVPDLFAGAPVRILVQLGGDRVTVEGRSACGGWSHTVDAAGSWPARADLARLWARERVADLEVAGAAGQQDHGEVERLGLAWGIVTRCTSFVAVSTASVVDPLAPGRRVVIPHELPAGMDVEGLGLRPATAAPPPPVCAAPMGADGGQGRAYHPGPGVLLSRRSSGPPPAPAPAATPEGLLSRLGRALSRAVRASAPRVVRHLWQGELLLVELEMSEDTTWTVPVEAVLVVADGSVLVVAVVPERTAVGGRLAAGAVVRVAVRVPGGACPVRRLRWDGYDLELGRG